MNRLLHTDVPTLAGNLFKLERCGKYAEAIAELGPVWENLDELPDFDALSLPDSAELLLRCGALVGFYGHIKLLPNSQERAKNLLTDARSRFFELENPEKVAECENYLALTYTRTGEFVEAEAFITESLAHSLAPLSDTRLSAIITKSLIFLTSKRYADLEALLCGAESDFRAHGNHYLLGSFCSNISVALRHLGRAEESLRYLEEARIEHLKSGHLIYLGTVENNLAYRYMGSSRFADAHRSIDRAIRIFRRCKDGMREGFAFDTKAQIFLTEGKADRALQAIENAIEILTPSDNAGWIVETIVTKARILIKLEGSTSALVCLSGAVQMANAKISEERALQIVREFEAELHAQTAASVIDIPAADEETTLELVLDPTIANFADYQGIRIKNHHLESFGIRQGSLAVVAKTDLKRGDLIAIRENTTDSVVCGFYDKDFGIVCLEGVGDEPLLFNENEITILGKIVGVGAAGPAQDGKIRITALNL